MIAKGGHIQGNTGFLSVTFDDEGLAIISIENGNENIVKSVSGTFDCHSFVNLSNAKGCSFNIGPCVNTLEKDTRLMTANAVRGYVDEKVNTSSLIHDNRSTTGYVLLCKDEVGQHYLGSFGSSPSSGGYVCSINITVIATTDSYSELLGFMLKTRKNNGPVSGLDIVKGYNWYIGTKWGKIHSFKSYSRFTRT